MKLEKTELPERFSRVPLYVPYVPLVQEFVDGGSECAEVVLDEDDEPVEKIPARLNGAIAHLMRSDVKVSVRGGRVFLIRV